MHERTHDGRAFRLLTILDEYTRECLAIDVKRQMNHQDVLDRLAELFVDRGVPEFIRSRPFGKYNHLYVREVWNGIQGHVVQRPQPPHRPITDRSLRHRRSGTGCRLLG